MTQQAENLPFFRVRNQGVIKRAASESELDWMARRRDLMKSIWPQPKPNLPTDTEVTKDVRELVYMGVTPEVIQAYHTDICPENMDILISKAYKFYEIATEFYSDQDEDDEDDAYVSTDDEIEEIEVKDDADDDETVLYRGGGLREDDRDADIGDEETVLYKGGGLRDEEEPALKKRRAMPRAQPVERPFTRSQARKNRLRSRRPLQ